MEDDLNFFENARRPYCHKLKKNNLNIVKNRRRPQKNKNKKAQHILPGNLTYTTTNKKSALNGCDIIVKIPLALMGVLAHGSTHA